VAAADQSPPLEWSKDQNVVWKAVVPGRGHSSPIVVGNRVLLTTAEEDVESQSVLCWDRETGKPLWKTEVHRGGLDRKGNKKTSQASSTLACDGEKVYVNFLNGGAVQTTALDLQGQPVWTTKVAEFATHQGFGSSPALHASLVFVTSDSRGGGVVAAIKRDTGKIVWRQQRPEKANYASPVVLNVAGREQVLVSGCDLVSSFAPATGEKLWEVEGATTECVTTIVSDGQRVFASGGYPRKHVQAIEADGSGKTAWENTSQVYVPSMIVRDGYLYAVQDAGIAVCWESATGKEIWKERLGGTFSASLVLVGDKLFAANEAGQTFIFRADPKKFELLATNQLGDEVMATPAICGGRIYHRVVDRSTGQRQEMLYCLGE
jgi:outer membrane protein assembly factor BamB